MLVLEKEDTVIYFEYGLQGVSKWVETHPLDLLGSKLTVLIKSHNIEHQSTSQYGQKKEIS